MFMVFEYCGRGWLTPYQVCLFISLLLLQCSLPCSASKHVHVQVSLKTLSLSVVFELKMVSLNQDALHFGNLVAPMTAFVKRNSSGCSQNL